MRKTITDALIVSAIGALVWLAFTGPKLSLFPSLPNLPSNPLIKPPILPNRPWWRPPWRPFRPDAEAQVGGGIAPDGVTQVACDLPYSLQLHNIGGSDGAGLCVFTSIGHAARWQNVHALKDFQKWMSQHPGGGYPEKVTQMINQMCKETGVPVPKYIQVEGNDLEILKLACKTGRMPGVTYSFSPTGRYGGQKIAHMVNIVNADDNFFAVLDNNYVAKGPDDKIIEWMTPDEFKKTYTADGGWAVILLPPSPAPPPHN